MSRLKVGLDLSPVAFRSRAPGTAVHVENQARALLKMDVEWEWSLVATPRVLADVPFFETFHPVIVPDAPLTYHVFWRLGRLWAKEGCSLGLATAFFAPLIGPRVLTNYFDANAYHPIHGDDTRGHRLKSHVVQALCAFSRWRSSTLFIDSEHGRSVMTAKSPATASKWVVAPCGCPPLEPPLSKKPSWANHLNGRDFILYAGAFSENKNQRRLIEAWDLLRRRYSSFPSLVLIGPCPAGYLQDVIAPARARTSQPNEIRIPGFLPSEEVAWAYHAAHAYIQPSFAEGFGMPIIEAMSCGVPVACSDSTSLPEVAGGAAILFDPSSVESIARAMETLVFDEARRAELKSAGLKRSGFFTWERHAAIVAARIGDELKRMGA